MRVAVTPLARKGLIGLAATLALAVIAYAGLLVYVRYFWMPRQLKLPKEVTEVLAGDPIVFLPPAPKPIQVLWHNAAGRPVSFGDTAALATWLCGANAPGDTTVLVDRSDGAVLLEMRVVRLTSSPISLPCKSRARFYAILRKPPRTEQ
jgi:hypothetical protein